MNRHDETDHELCRRASAGDREAFRVLVERHHAVVWRVALAAVRDEHVAADLSQDVFLRFLRRLREGGESPDSVEGFLVTATANAARDEIRRRSRRPTVSIDSAADVVAPDRHVSDPFRDASVVAGLLPEALLRLSEERRVLVTLRDVKGEAYEAIARRVRLPLGTVKSRIHRARLQLRDLLTEAVERARAADREV
ncbi:MAG: sigma-70 family RNA polymerase sigma factor [Planctomycetes bacterium]|nr:sigma-70 family RNA polymerase sigma factor [Planctomycetota bacterium]MBI3845942.1 sigma-70 family RNA polymerase sigma factor [Planctomycetota bacterium]